MIEAPKMLQILQANGFGDVSTHVMHQLSHCSLWVFALVEQFLPYRVEKVQNPSDEQREFSAMNPSIKQSPSQLGMLPSTLSIMFYYLFVN